jgi:hypothetical protein
MTGPPPIEELDDDVLLTTRQRLLDAIDQTTEVSRVLNGFEQILKQLYAAQDKLDAELRRRGLI